MKVCLVSYEFPPDVGGEASYAHALASGLSSLGHEVTVLVPKKQGVEYSKDGGFRILAVRASSIPGLKVASFVIAVNRLLPPLVRSEGTDVVHVVFDYPSFPFRVRGVGAPVFATVHHLHVAEALGALRAGGSFARRLPGIYSDFLLSLMEVVLVRRAASVVTVSAFTRNSLRSYLRVNPDRVRVVPNGIGFRDLLEAKDTGRARQRFGLGSGPLLLYVGRLEPSKGLEALLAAFEVAVRSLPEVRLAVVGRGSERYTLKLKRMAASLGLEGKVTFTGRVGRAELCELYAASTVMVLPSLMEGFGISLAEAMAAGKPCVATKVGAVPEVVSDGVTGLLVPPGSPRELAEAILKVLRSPDAGAGRGRRGRELVVGRFTVDRMARETTALYADALSPSARLALK